MKGPWTVHSVHDTPEAIRFHPAIPLGGGVEVWAHRIGDAPWLWYPWAPVRAIPPGTTLRDLDAVASKDAGAPHG